MALLVACQSDRPETGEVTLPVSAPRPPTPATAVVPSPKLPPPGSAALVRVPASVARGVKLATAASGFERPVLLVVAPGDARKRLFVVEQRGKIRIVENGVIAKRPFFETDKRLSTGGEEGLLGLAFHPQFASNRKIYVDYTTADKNTHIVEYHVSESDPDRVDMTTAR
ncbi:MAG TPA: PQQ-dependent sugar dehydrogenase, partial [Kofleriaceae bacterium]|nr:PQQ-dependent sugar dehydrogenase [Kofleriaceae bacterium]